ncbi:MAG: hypothetical protein MJA30_27935, partial [Cytophagales bacterium]|nr:hypothetical protein [Cytophagales bacterium]
VPASNWDTPWPLPNSPNRGEATKSCSAPLQKTPNQPRASKTRGSPTEYVRILKPSVQPSTIRDQSGRAGNDTHGGHVA